MKLSKRLAQSLYDLSHPALIEAKAKRNRNASAAVNIQRILKSNPAIQADLAGKRK